MSLRNFFSTEASSGIVLLIVALLAMLAANSPLAGLYDIFISLSAHAINDGLMVLFFLLIGMEIRRELTEGELKGFRQAVLPVGAAMGGVMLPAIIFLTFNGGTPHARGWAVPTATDIAFSLGVLALLGRRVPPQLKLFLMAVAVIDDLIAILIIALFYAGALNLPMLLAAAGIFAILLVMQRRGISSLWPYLLLGLALWLAVLQSGIHATIAGVLLAFVIPSSRSPALERVLHPWVAFGVVPLFAFANAGVPLVGMEVARFMEPLPLGIALGLFFGKQLGIFAFAALLIRTRVVLMPQGVSWTALYGVCMIAGIGFTMSLFIGALAFGDDVQAMVATRLGVLTGSLFSGLIGYIFLAIALNRRATRA